MADAGQFAKDADILLRVGTGAAATVKAAGWFDTIIVDAEATICSMSRFDWVAADTATTITASVRGILIETGACLAAIQGVIWDMSSYASRTEAENIVNVLRDIAIRNLGILRDKRVQNFINGA